MSASAGPLSPRPGCVSSSPDHHEIRRITDTIDKKIAYGVSPASPRHRALSGNRASSRARANLECERRKTKCPRHLLRFFTPKPHLTFLVKYHSPKSQIFDCATTIKNSTIPSLNIFSNNFLLNKKNEIFFMFCKSEQVLFL